MVQIRQQMNFLDHKDSAGKFTSIPINRFFNIFNKNNHRNVNY